MDDQPTLRSVTCTRCAGPLTAADGERLLSCDHCGTSFLVPLQNGIARRYFPTGVKRLEAVGKASAWLRQYPDLPRDIDSAVFAEATLLYIPIWEVRAYLVGWEFGKKLRTRAEVVPAAGLGGLSLDQDDAVRLKLVDEGVQEGFLDERRLYQPAIDLMELGMARPHITGREFALPLLPGELEPEAAVLDASGDFLPVVKQARELFMRPPTGTYASDRKLFLLRETVSLLYYPLWSLKYRYHGRLYEMSVDGRNGVIHSFRAPADNTRRLAALLASYAMLAIGLAVASASWQAWMGIQGVGLYLTVLCLALAGGVYWRFHLLREVEYHEPFSS